MKHILCIFMIFSLLHCSEDDVVVTGQDKFDDSDYYEAELKLSCRNLFNQISFDGTMLVFEDARHYEDVIDCLEGQVDRYNDVIESQYAHLDDEQINDVIELYNIDEDKPLSDFEARFHRYSTKRQEIEEKTEIWLNNSSLDFDNDPDDDGILYEEERALLNRNCEVKIGKDVFNACIGEFSKSVFSCNDDGCCWGGKDREVFSPINAGNRRIKLVVKITGYPWKSKVKSKIVSYRRRNGRWKKFRRNLTASHEGVLRDENCSNEGLAAASKSRRRKKVKAKTNIWGAFPYIYVSDNDIVGIYRFDNIDVALPLTPE